MKTVSFEQLFDRLVSMAEANGFTVYNICFRMAGVGIMWCDQRRLKEVGADRYRDSLIVYHYYPTLLKAVECELKNVQVMGREVAEV